ncbi:MAG TPA: glycosyltransferase family 4 protein [Sphingomonas sp.]|uniref:glycosyltransferase family 4 protein n=1 Tax=Sphingomonas sp. TaxID=28214 RepID=UPI002B958D50|nr:glycosyltransferase family 4 protein [Sphingomonas sp.]HMI21136.1 glycosyltransferase family 4 protein [Sphingomonas sp.]
MPARAALQYSAESFDTRVGEMMGRRMAGETFLKAWIDHADADPLTAWVHNRADAKAFVAHARELRATAPIAVAGVENFAPLIDAGTLWLGDPSLARQAWERRWFRQDAWSIVGITHTISSHLAADRLAEILTSPVQPWDALICTSRAVRNVVRTMLAEHSAFLAARLGATTCTGPELPIIPLGVDCAGFAHDPAQRARWRAELGIGADDVAVLQFGRMAFHLKAHPQPLYLALRQAAETSDRRLHLIFAGQPINPGQAETFRDLAAAFADTITTHFVDGARADAGSVRSAADIFTLLSDNIQESFGLAPVEAMAAGLPVVGSDWDGLRDTIEHDVTGFLIDSILPSRGAAELLARRHAFAQDDYHFYIGSVAQMTAIDVGQAARAFSALAADPDLRQRMGEAGRVRAQALFDWRVVIGAYRGLIDQLTEIRTHAPERAPRGNGPANPARMDPTHLFGGYPTARLDSATRLIATGLTDSVNAIPGGFEAAVLVRRAVPAPAILDRMLAQLAAAPVTMADLCAAFPDQDPRMVVMGAAFLMKFGLATRV